MEPSGTEEAGNGISGERSRFDPTQNVLNLVAQQIKRQDDLRESEACHIREITKLRAVYEDKLRAETLRIQVATTAAAATTALGTALEPIQKDIADLRRAQYEQAGQKAQVGESREITASRLSANAVLISAALLVLGVIGLVIAIIARHP